MTRSARTLTATAALLALASAARAADEQGPPLGTGRYEAAIARVCSEPDTDDYVGSLVQGEKLSVTLAVKKGSALLPRLTLVAPDGEEIAPPVLGKNGGKTLSLRGYVVPRTGRWAVRVAGADGTEGAYTVDFGVTPAADVRLKKYALNAQDDTRIDFEGLDGALLDVKLSWAVGDPPVILGAIEDPSHQPVPSVTVAAGRNSLSVKGAVLHSGDGTYGLHVLRTAGAPTVNVTLHVTPQERLASRKPIRLADTEPWLEAHDTPMRGIGGMVVHLKGGNFSSENPPTVLFGRERVTPVVRAADSLDVITPYIAAGTTVDVAVVGADGQGCVRPAYFQYVATPVVSDLVDDNDAAVRLGPAAGGATLWLRGSRFASDQTVRFGTVPATVLTVMNETRMRVVVPPSEGKVSIYVSDPFGHTGQSSFLYEYKSPPRFGAAPYSPPYGSLAGGNTITVSGTGFEPNDRIVFDGNEIATTYVDANHVRFVTPKGDAGTHTVGVRDRFDGFRAGPDFEFRGPPKVTSVVATGGACLDAAHVAAGGGGIVRISGTGFDATNVVRLGGGLGSVLSATDTTLTFVAGGAPIGAADLVVTDVYGQSVTKGAALELVGWADDTADCFPSLGAVDDLTARRGVLADFDGDGLEDDLVIVSSAVSPGSRQEFTRLFFHDATGFTDATGTNLPAARTDAAGADEWKASAVAVSDLDWDGSPDIVLAGPRVAAASGGSFEARLLLNDGGGSFAPDERGPEVRSEPWYCYDTYWGGTYRLFSPAAPTTGAATCAALGDIDSDGDDDLVVGSDHYRTGTLHIPLWVVSFQGEMGYGYYAGNYYSWNGSTVDAPALRVFENRLDWGEAFRDTSFVRLPRSEQNVGSMPAFHARDLALADVDGDDDLDIVVAWDDPRTVSPAGLASPGQAAPQTATRILVNDGSGSFSDQTDSWMPGPSGSEYWQADRLLVTDLDGDGDPDMVLVHRSGIDAWTGTPSHGTSALRILRNGGEGTGFVDVTAAALPSVPLAGTANDDLRGSALSVLDFDGDGLLDLVVGTTESLSNGTGGLAPSTRLLRGRAGLAFTSACTFLPAATSDSGEAGEIVIGDLSGSAAPTIVLLTETHPARSADGNNLRVLDWNE